jgi:Lipocalin-like domain
VLLRCSSSTIRGQISDSHSRSVFHSSDAKRLIGTWQLVSIDVNDEEYRRAVGAHPIGMISYDATVHMAAQIMPDRSRRRYTGPPSGAFAGPQPNAEEALDALTGYTAYFGTYAVDERTHTVTHRRLGNINPGGLGAFPRRYEFKGDDRLTLTALDNQNLRIVRATVERLK